MEDFFNQISIILTSLIEVQVSDVIADSFTLALHLIEVLQDVKTNSLKGVFGVILEGVEDGDEDLVQVSFFISLAFSNVALEIGDGAGKILKELFVLSVVEIVDQGEQLLLEVGVSGSALVDVSSGDVEAEFIRDTSHHLGLVSIEVGDLIGDVGVVGAADIIEAGVVGVGEDALEDHKDKLGIALASLIVLLGHHEVHE